MEILVLIMYAQNVDALRKLLTENPEESPSVFLTDNSFAAACYDNQTIKELNAAFNRDADPEECEAWGLSPSEWKENVEMALIALQAVHKKR
jgi:hypothetical protein